MDEIQFLKFEDWQKEIFRDMLADAWITVYDFHEEASGTYATFCGLISNKQESIREVLSDFSWDINVEYGHPKFWRGGMGGPIHYARFGGISGRAPFEPLVICRSFHGRWEGYLELSEEFRLYHNLYHDKSKNEFISLAQSGEEEVVACIEEKDDSPKVQIKTCYLRNFLAAKSMALVRFYDHRRYSEKDLTSKLGKDLLIIKKVEGNFCFNITLYPKHDPLLEKVCSGFLGKNIVPPLPEPSHEDYKFLKGAREKKYVNFTIGTDPNGNPIEHTCNPNTLSNSFGANPGAPNYLTPVFFKREVLKKYYDQPSKYSVEDNYLKCCYLWSMRYGQNPSGFVHAWLGDLGRDLPYNEQLNWKQYNIASEGGLGEATIKRELLGQFADPDEITHIFKFEFSRFCAFWKSKLGWDLFLPLSNDDEHFMKSLHVPTSENPLEFDRQILALAKILPDSINVSELEKLIKPSPPGSINILGEALVHYFKVEEAKTKEIVKPLRKLQSLRSSSVAHRKGSKYKETAKSLRLDKMSFTQSFKELLEDIVGLLKEIQDL